MVPCSSEAPANEGDRDPDAPDERGLVGDVEYSLSPSGRAEAFEEHGNAESCHVPWVFDRVAIDWALSCQDDAESEPTGQCEEQ